MNGDERKALADLVRIVESQQSQIQALAEQDIRFGLVVQSLNRRLMLQEAGTALYEVENLGRVLQ